MHFQSSLFISHRFCCIDRSLSFSHLVGRCTHTPEFPTLGFNRMLPDMVHICAYA